MGTLVEHQAAEAVEEIVVECEIDAENALFDLPPCGADGRRPDVLAQLSDSGAIRRHDDFWVSEEARRVLAEFDSTTQYDVTGPEILRSAPEYFVQVVASRRTFGHPYLAGLACLYCSSSARQAFEAGDYAEARRLADMATKWAIAARAGAPFEHMAQLRDEAAEHAGLLEEIRRVERAAIEKKALSDKSRLSARRRRHGKTTPTQAAMMREHYVELHRRGVPERDRAGMIGLHLVLKNGAVAFGQVRHKDLRAIWSQLEASGGSKELAAEALALEGDYVKALLEQHPKKTFA